MKESGIADLKTNSNYTQRERKSFEKPVFQHSLSLMYLGWYNSDLNGGKFAFLKDPGWQFALYSFINEKEEETCTMEIKLNFACNRQAQQGRAST